LQKLRFVDSIASFSLKFLTCLTHSINQGWVSLFNGRVTCKNKERQQPAIPVCGVLVSMPRVGNLSVVASQKQTLQGMAGRTNFPQTIPFPLLFMMLVNLEFMEFLIRLTAHFNSS